MKGLGTWANSSGAEFSASKVNKEEVVLDQCYSPHVPLWFYIHLKVISSDRSTTLEFMSHRRQVGLEEKLLSRLAVTWYISQDESDEHYRLNKDLMLVSVSTSSIAWNSLLVSHTHTMEPRHCLISDIINYLPAFCAVLVSQTRVCTGKKPHHDSPFHFMDRLFSNSSSGQGLPPPPPHRKYPHKSYEVASVVRSPQALGWVALSCSHLPWVLQTANVSEAAALDLLGPEWQI